MIKRRCRDARCGIGCRWRRRSIRLGQLLALVARMWLLRIEAHGRAFENTLDSGFGDAEFAATCSWVWRSRWVSIRSSAKHEVGHHQRLDNTLIVNS